MQFMLQTQKSALVGNGNQCFHYFGFRPVCETQSKVHYIYKNYLKQNGELTSLVTAEYSLIRSTATMLVSNSLLWRTIQFSEPVICRERRVFKILWRIL